MDEIEKLKEKEKHLWIGEKWKEWFMDNEKNNR